MAFERPLEADRVDDIGFLSSFVRAPIVGPIMWMLGGDMARKLEKEEREHESYVITGQSQCGGKNAVNQVPFRSNPNGGVATAIQAPDVEYSDVSDSGDCSLSDLEDRRTNMTSDETVCADVTGLLTRTQKGHNLNKSQKRLSFSDEVPGKALVEYMEVSEISNFCPMHGALMFGTLFSKIESIGPYPAQLKRLYMRKWRRSHPSFCSYFAFIEGAVILSSRHCLSGSGPVATFRYLSLHFFVRILEMY